MDWFRVLSQWLALLFFVVGCGTRPVPRVHDPRLLDAVSTWVAGDGKVLTYRVWDVKEPGDAPPCILVAVHGFGGSGADFARLAEAASARGITLYAMEHRGMGRDPAIGQRGDLRQADLWIHDLGEFVELVRRKHPGTPVVVVGESLGVSIVLEWLATVGDSNVRPAGFVALSPVVEMGGEMGWGQRQIYRILVGLTPKRVIRLADLDPKIESNGTPPMTPIPEQQAYLESAPHRLDEVTLRFVDASVGLLNRSGENLRGLDGIPRILIHGGRDAFIDASEVAAFGGAFASLPGDARVVYYPEGHHLLMRDYMADEVIATILDFSMNVIGDASD